MDMKWILHPNFTYKALELSGQIFGGIFFEFQKESFFLVVRPLKKLLIVHESFLFYLWV